MKVKDIQDENFQDYKKISMFIATCRCSWKCCLDAGVDKSMCQNSSTAQLPTIDIPDMKIVERYVSNPITQAVVIGGLEPFEQFEELLKLVRNFRKKTNDDIVIYTGFREEEIDNYVEQLKQFPNIVIKFGRYIPNKESSYNAVLGVTLANPEQYAKRVS